MRLPSSGKDDVALAEWKASDVDADDEQSRCRRARARPTDKRPSRRGLFVAWVLTCRQLLRLYSCGLTISIPDVRHRAGSR